MSKAKRSTLRILAIVLAILMSVMSAHAAMAADDDPAEDKTTKYASPDINKLTGHGEDPEEISVSTTAHYAEKNWYEYITYSEDAVASYRIDDYNRLLFYDPYTYTNAMVMDVKFDAATTEFDTMSSYTISHTNSKTLSSATDSIYTSSSAVQSSGKDVTESNVENTGETITKYNHKTESTETGGDTTTKNYGSITTKDESRTTSDTFGSEMGTGDIVVALMKTETNIADYSSTSVQTYDEMWSETTGTDIETTTDYSGEDKVTYDTESKTTGWTELSDRITKTVGSSQSTSTGWSETESTTVSKTYAATHFASDGVTPLPWAIVHYTVQMPMKCAAQYKYQGEWITVGTVYCMLTTIKGTCRTWIENGQAYYEDWGNGEPVVAEDFWSQFMTKEQLMNAYENKLYPVGGEN